MRSATIVQIASFIDLTIRLENNLVHLYVSEDFEHGGFVPKREEAWALKAMTQCEVRDDAIDRRCRQFLN